MFKRQYSHTSIHRTLACDSHSVGRGTLSCCWSASSCFSARTCSSPCADRALRCIARIGEGPYKGLYSVVCDRGLDPLGYGFAHYRGDRLDRRLVSAALGPATSPMLLMWPAMHRVVAAYIRGHIERVLKHPMLVGVKPWAVAHLVANGDLGSIILFGSVLAGRCMTASRSSAAPIPARRRSRSADAQRRHRASSSARCSISRSASYSIRSSSACRYSVGRRIGIFDMSVQDEIRRLTAPDIRARKGGEPIVCADLLSRPYRAAASTSIATSSWSATRSAW